MNIDDDDHDDDDHDEANSQPNGWSKRANKKQLVVQ